MRLVKTNKMRTFEHGLRTTPSKIFASGSVCLCIFLVFTRCHQKLKNKELSILLKFWSRQLLEHWKTYLFANFQFNRAFRLVTKQGRISKLLRDTILKWRPRMLMKAKKSNLSAKISQSEQSLHENKFSCRCFWALRRCYRLFIENSMTCFCQLPAIIFVPLRGPYKFE